MTPPGMRLVVAALAAACCAIAAPVARADGDPASDVLISQKVFFSYVKLPEASKTALSRAVAQANDGGYTVRVALIGNRFDLGSVPVFWSKPQPYAKFLSQELLGPAPYTNRILVAMPNGFGLSRNGKSLPAERRALDRVASADTRDEDIAAAALRAVRVLAALRGVSVTAGAAGDAGGSSGNGDRIVIAGAALAVIAVAGAAVFLRRRRG
jgi:hypothetical protein